MRSGGSGLGSGGRVEGASPLTAPHRPSPCRPLTLPSPLRGEGYREERPLENGVAAVDDEGVAGVVAARVAGEVDRDPAEVAAGAPAPRPIMCRAAARRVKNAPSRFTASTRCHSSVVISAKLAAAPRPETPALTKQASTPPRVETVSAKARATAASSLTSQRRATAFPPIACRRASAVRFFSSL